MRRQNVVSACRGGWRTSAMKWLPTAGITDLRFKINKNTDREA